ncbi:MAG: BrxA/BrxB family bacilliredoxin [Pyrinomonadaceae bacterium]|nr:BrxA/BrxB family bacilliredoxin [Pyrinomonadaceae bacterium]MCX7639565.1 BrxA/BrxB family bacilliredoxin [Pyrinomonadaceae bacterium]MDW8303958.1 BrxA/BrxB family bacilliredoxin [Acidobacteriota bacterium]
MPYPEIMIQGMRRELTQIGIEETRTPEQVVEAIENTKGILMVVVNSVCGCAAAGVRPGIALALQKSSVKPDRAITVFAGADIDATEKAREYFKPYPPSSPSIALLKDGKLLKMFERKDLEGKHPVQIAQELIDAFEQFCSASNAASN